MMRYKKAPRDTIEAELNREKPALRDTLDVHYTLFFDRNLQMEIQQVEKNNIGTRNISLNYRLKRKKEQLIQILKPLVHGKLPEYSICINLKIKKEDARVIYRSLPAKALLALKVE